MRRIARMMLMAVLLLAAGCSGETAPDAGAGETEGPAAPAGFQISRVLSGLQGPTQMIVGPDNRLWVAQLAGGENEGRGEVRAFDLQSGSEEVLLENLLKPTGIAVLDGALWIAVENDLLRAELDENSLPLTPQTVLANLPYNGRSNGTLTVTPEGRLLYETSGRREGNQAQDGSGILWELDPRQPQNPQPLAMGLKGAYAHAVGPDGRLWITEIGDDRVNGEPPPDELNLVVPGADFGWPSCFDDRLPARNYGGTEESCAATRPPVVTFPPRSTPTSVVAAPWNQNLLLVALWNLGEVVAVTVTADGDNATGEVSSFLALPRPQHLLALEDGSLLISDYRNGEVFQLTQEP